jgi:hypothetical protein
MDNQPAVVETDPKFQSLCVETANLLQIARQVAKVRDIKSLEKAVDVREDVKEFCDRAEKMRKSLTAPTRLYERSVNSAFKTLLDKLDEIALKLSKNILDWQTRNNPDKREIRTEHALVRLRRNAPVPQVVDKLAFLRAIVSKAEGRKDLTVDLVEVSAVKLKALIKDNYGKYGSGKKMPPGVEMVNRPDSLI